MTLKQMEYFLSCATLLNFRKAAQLHYISPPTLTRHISALEAELNTSLFVRDSHSVSLTATGYEFFNTAYQILVAYQNFYDRTNSNGLSLQRQGNPFLIGSYAFDGMYGRLVDQILAQSDYFLGKPIHIDFIDAGQMIPSVKNGDIQIGIDSEAYIRKSGNLYHTKLLQTVPFHAAVGAGHPLNAQKRITLEELLSFFTDHRVHPMEGNAFLNKLTFPVDSAEALRKIGEFTIEALPELFPILDYENIGKQTIAILPKTLCAGNIRQLHSIEIIGNPCTTNYMLFWRKNNDNPDIAKFIAALQF